MPTAPLRTGRVFDFINGKNDYVFSNEFQHVLGSSSKLFIVMNVGNGRVGKSTRLNQLIRRDIYAEEPFESYGGSAPVTMEFQFYGPMKLRELCEIHQLTVSVNPDDDVLLIDCEGLNSLGQTTPGLKNAMFALAQITNLVVLVMKEIVNQENLESVRSLLALTRVFTHEIQNFATGTVILERDVGVACSRSTSFDEKNRVRIEADRVRKSQVLNLLNNGNTILTDQTFALFGQPQFDTPELYWNSMNDFLTFVHSVASRHRQIPGSTLIALFEKAKSSFKAIPGLNQPLISMKQIHDEFVEVRLCEAERITIAKIDEVVISPIQRLSKTDIQRGPNSGFVAERESELIRLFESKSKELYQNAPSINPMSFKKHKDDITAQIRSRADKAYLDRVVREILPDELRSILNSLKTRLNQAASNISPQSVMNYSFSQMRSQYRSMVDQECNQMISRLGGAVRGTSEYSSGLSQLQGDIETAVNAIETTKRNEHQAWQRRENERIAREQREREERERERLAREAEEYRERLRQEEAARQRRIAEEAEREQRRLAEQRRIQAENLQRLERLRREEEAARLAREQQVAQERAEAAQRERDRQAAIAREEARRREMEAEWERRRRESDGCLLL
jgi:hypothetical protein